MKPSNKIASELSSLYILLFDREEQLQPSNWLVVERFNLRSKFPGLFGAFPKSTSVPSIEISVAEALTPKIKSHPGYVWLSRVPAIHDGLKIVQQHSTEMSEFPELLRLRHIRYWEAVAAFFGGVTTEQNVAPKTFSASEKQTIAKKAEELSGSLRDGVGDFSSINSWELREKLDRLATDLRSVQTRCYATPDREKVYLVTALARGLISLDLKNDTAIANILQPMCEAIELDRSYRQLQRYVQYAHKQLKRWRIDKNR